MATFHLRVVTPERTVLDREVTAIITRSVEGELGILPHHMPLITPLVAHVLTVYLEDQNTLHIAVAGGFLEVNPEATVILADFAEIADEIDQTRAEAARERAQGRLASPDAEIDVARAKRALARAESRLKVKAGILGRSRPSK